MVNTKRYPILYNIWTRIGSYLWSYWITADRYRSLQMYIPIGIFSLHTHSNTHIPIGIFSLHTHSNTHYTL